MKWDKLWTGANLATMRHGSKEDNPYSALLDGAIATKDGKIAWIGARENLPSSADNLCGETIELTGQWITPGLIDCHTHLVYGGNRINEFEARLQGASYAQIAKQGGGILSTVTATRETDVNELSCQAASRLHNLVKEGVTTVEIKSGYGLDIESEIKMLQATKQVEKQVQVNVCTTFLGAHTLPPEYKSSADNYIDLVCQQMIPEVKKLALADAVDVFCEHIAFDLAQTEKVLQTAINHGLAVKVHADQLSNMKSAQLAARYNALSADHLEYTDEAAARLMGQHGTVAVLLPGAFYFLRERQLPPVALFRKYDVPIAIATDHNPGSSPILSLLATLNMACVLFSLTPEEALKAVTCNAAKALNMDHSIGTLEVGKAADFCIWDIQQPAELCYYIGANPLQSRVYRGEID